MVRETMARGTEPTSAAILAFARERRIAWHHIVPGKPMQDGFMENFNGRMRDEILSKTVFRNIAHARAVILAFAASFNETRPHPEPGYQAPKDFAAHFTTASGPRAAPSESAARRPVAPSAPSAYQPKAFRVWRGERSVAGQESSSGVGKQRRTG